MSRKTWEGRISLGDYVDPDTGKRKQRRHFVGRYPTKRQRDEAVAQAKLRRKRGGDPLLPTVEEQVDRYLADYARRNKDSSLDTQRRRLRRFREDFADQSIDLSRAEIKDWIHGEGRWAERGPLPLGDRPAIVSFFNHAMDEDDLPLERNPARGLSKRYEGRGDEPPPTEAEFARLLDACSVLGDYEPMMRGLFLFGAFTLMRPGELFALEWTDIDFPAMRVRKARRLYRGRIAEPKTGPKVIALTPPARDAIAGLPRDGDLVFTSKTGKRLSAGALSLAWGRVLARADLDFDFYLATKHYGVWFMWTQLRLSDRAIAAQAGWSIKTVAKMLDTYGHGQVGALDEVDAAFANAPEVGAKPGLRLVSGTQT